MGAVTAGRYMQAEEEHEPAPKCAPGQRHEAQVTNLAPSCSALEARGALQSLACGALGMGTRAQLGHEQPSRTLAFVSLVRCAVDATLSCVQA